VAHVLDSPRQHSHWCLGYFSWMWSPCLQWLPVAWWHSWLNPPFCTFSPLLFLEIQPPPPSLKHRVPWARRSVRSKA
jgi:hypothetical protein